jgi:uncharacterized membrane protein
MDNIKSEKVAGVSPIDEAGEKKHPPITGGIKLAGSQVVQAPASVCYAYWRDFQNLPSFMTHLESVVVTDSRRSHWMVKGPADTTLEWDAEIIEDIPDERISWRSTENAQINNAGSVEFVPVSGGQATEIKVNLTYNPPLGPIGVAISKLFGENPANQIAEDLKHFKDALETVKRFTPSP